MNEYGFNGGSQLSTTSRPSQAGVNVPQRETAITREVDGLFTNVQLLENLGDALESRLSKYLGGSRPTGEQGSKVPEARSEFAQSIYSANERLTAVAYRIEELLARLEI